MKSITFAVVVPSDSMNTCCTANVPAPVVVAMSWIAKVTPSARMYPKIADTTIDMTTPRAAARPASRVSSLICADASYPVYVYCACNRPKSRTNQSQPCPQPLLLIVCENTFPTD